MNDARIWRGWVVPAMLLGVLLMAGVDAYALPSFGSQQYLNSNWATDGAATDEGFNVATDGAGNWITVWYSDSTLGGTIGSDLDILYAVSSDDGLTWSAPAALNTDAASDGSSFDAHPAIGYNGAGVWIASWSGGGPQVARSFDGGATWSAPVAVDTIGGSDLTMKVSGSTAVLILRTSDTFSGTIGNDDDLLYSRSTDSGATWSPLAVLNSTAATDASDVDDTQPALATDGAGNWIAVWEMRDGAIAAVHQSVSTDDGATWSATVDLSALTGGVDDEGPAIETDGAGRWMLTWNTDANPVGAPSGTKDDIWVSVSDDLGVTWSPAALANSTALAPNSGVASEAAIVTNGTGTWVISWNEVGLGSPYKGAKHDSDLFYSVSIDDGASWGEAALLNSSGAVDGDFLDRSSVLVYGGSGTWLAAWEHALPGVSPPAGSDRDLLFARAVEQCPTTPAAGCLGTTTPGKGRVKLLKRPGQKSKLQWKASRVEETTLADLADPTVSSDYLLCMYDGTSGGDRLVYERELLAGTTCKGSPCWSSIGGGYKYRDPRLENGPIKTVKLQTGADGEARYQLQAKGQKMGPPALPLQAVSPVRLQLTSQDSGTCWEATISAPDRNTADQFKGRSD